MSNSPSYIFTAEPILNVVSPSVLNTLLTQIFNLSTKQSSK